MRTWWLLGVMAVTACPRGATENERCVKGADCAAGLSCCDGACIDVTRDTRHCGACGEACGTQGAVATCQAGVCRVACTEGFADCNLLARDGCEVNLRTSATDCGACGAACVLPSATPACIAGQCAIAACQPGFADCDTRASTGCEVAPSTDVQNCGGCGALCAPPNATPRCIAGRCRVGTCSPGRADCDADDGNGCEVDTRISPQHCGGCGAPCGADEACVSGVCQVLELFVFGGQEEPGAAVSDVAWRLVLGQRSFTQVATAPSPEAPAARAHHVAAYDVSGTRLLVLGGSDTAGVPVGDELFALDLSQTPPRWSVLATTGPAPGALTGMAAGWDRMRRRWFVFGGSARAFTGTPGAQLSVLDAATLTWSQPAVGGAAPSPRGFAAATWDDASQRFVVHGGVGSGGAVLGDTWLFDPATNLWTQTTMSGPGPRVGSTFFPGSSPPLLFGGADALGPPLTHFDDLWALDAAAGTWTRRATVNGPQARRDGVGVTLGEVRHLVTGVFDDGATQTLFNDVWALQWPQETWQQVRSNSPIGAVGARVGFSAVGRARP